VLSGLATEVGDLSPEFSLSDIPGYTDVSEAVSEAYSAVSDPVQQAYSAASDVVSPIAQSLGLHSEPSQFSVTPGNMGPRRLPSQVPLQGIQPPPLQIDHTGPLGTEVHDPLGGDIYESGLISPGFTIGELLEYGIAPVPKTTSMFAAHGGFVDKPLYSRS
jgi:hypothetical protein